MEMVADPVPILGSSCPGGRKVISLFQNPVVPGWKPASARAVMRGLADKMFRLERVKVLFNFLPFGASLGWPLALCPSLYFLAGLILWSTCRAIPAKCSLKEFERASQSVCMRGKGMSFTSRNCSKSSGKASGPAGIWKRRFLCPRPLRSRLQESPLSLGLWIG